MQQKLYFLHSDPRFGSEGFWIAPILRIYSRVYRELVDSFLRIILSGIFLVVAKGLGSIEVLVESFFNWELLMFLDRVESFLS